MASRYDQFLEFSFLTSRVAIYCGLLAHEVTRYTNPQRVHGLLVDLETMIVPITKGWSSFAVDLPAESDGIVDADGDHKNPYSCAHEAVVMTSRWLVERISCEVVSRLLKEANRDPNDYPSLRASPPLAIKALEHDSDAFWEVAKEILSRIHTKRWNYLRAKVDRERAKLLRTLKDLEDSSELDITPGAPPLRPIGAHFMDSAPTNPRSSRETLPSTLTDSRTAFGNPEFVGAEESVAFVRVAGSGPANADSDFEGAHGTGRTIGVFSDIIIVNGEPLRLDVAGQPFVMFSRLLVAHSQRGKPSYIAGLTREIRRSIRTALSSHSDAKWIIIKTVSGQDAVVFEEPPPDIRHFDGVSPS